MNFKTLFYWLVRSSKDSSKWSTTIKATGASIIPILAIFHLDTSGWSEVFQHVAVFAEVFGLLITAGYAVWGSVRKVQLTMAGQNDVLNNKIWE
jgi:hypothetical protein